MIRGIILYYIILLLIYPKTDLSASKCFWSKLFQPNVPSVRFILSHNWNQVRCCSLVHYVEALHDLEYLLDRLYWPFTPDSLFSIACLLPPGFECSLPRTQVPACLSFLSWIFRMCILAKMSQYLFVLLFLLSVSSLP